MFEDEAGTMTWVREHVGVPTKMDWYESAKGSGAIVATDEGVIASMDLRSHSLKWRAVLPERETFTTTAVTKGSVVAASFDKSRGGCTIRAYERSDGRLRWDALVGVDIGSEDATQQLGAVSIRVVGPDKPTGPHKALVTCGPTVAALSLVTGDELWTLDLDDGQVATEGGPWVALAADANPSASGTAGAATLLVAAGRLAPGTTAVGSSSSSSTPLLLSARAVAIEVTSGEAGAPVTMLENFPVLVPASASGAAAAAVVARGATLASLGGVAIAAIGSDGSTAKVATASVGSSGSIQTGTMDASAGPGSESPFRSLSVVSGAAWVAPASRAKADGWSAHGALITLVRSDGSTAVVGHSARAGGEQDEGSPAASARVLGWAGPVAATGGSSVHVPSKNAKSPGTHGHHAVEMVAREGGSAESTGAAHAAVGLSLLPVPGSSSGLTCVVFSQGAPLQGDAPAGDSSPKPASQAHALHYPCGAAQSTDGSAQRPEVSSRRFLLPAGSTRGATVALFPSRCREHKGSSSKSSDWLDAWLGGGAGGSSSSGSISSRSRLCGLQSTADGALTGRGSDVHHPWTSEESVGRARTVLAVEASPTGGVSTASGRDGSKAGRATSRLHGVREEIAADPALSFSARMGSQLHAVLDATAAVQQAASAVAADPMSLLDAASWESWASSISGQLAAGASSYAGKGRHTRERLLIAVAPPRLPESAASRGMAPLTGGIVALLGRTGAVSWSRSFPLGGGAVQVRGAAAVPLRSSPLGQAPPEILVVETASGPGTSGKPVVRMTVVDAWSGETLSSAAAKGKAQQVVPLPVEDEHGRQAVLVIASTATAGQDETEAAASSQVAYLVPSTPQTRQRLGEISSTLVIHSERRAAPGSASPDYVDGLALSGPALDEALEGAVASREAGLGEDELLVTGPVPVETIWSLSSRSAGALLMDGLDESEDEASASEESAAAPANDRLLAVSSPLGETERKSQADQMSAGLALGDDSVLVRYPSAHLLAVVTGSEAGGRGPPPASGSDASGLPALAAGGSDGAAGTALVSASGALAVEAPKPSQQSITVRLVDAVSGRVLYSKRHLQASGPASVARLADGVAVSYWQSKANRYELVVLQPNLGAIPRFGLNPFQQPKAAAAVSKPRSAFAATAPRVLEQKYVLPVGVQAMGATVTRGGINRRQVLVATPQGTVYAMDESMLSPRRPAGKPTDADKKEGLAMYSPYLPLVHLRMPTHSVAVARPRSVTSAAAALESTSMVVLSGLDLFVGKTRPTTAFDALPPDFNFAVTGALVLGAVVLAVTSVVLLRQRRLADAWR